VERILRRLIAVVLLTLLLVGFAGSSALAAPRDDCGSELAAPRVALATTDDCGSHHHYGGYPVIFDHPDILDHPVLNNPVFNTYNNPRFIYKDNTYNNRYNNRY
jgi:hypothetical protein